MRTDTEIIFHKLLEAKGGVVYTVKTKTKTERRYYRGTLKEVGCHLVR
jgi:hypothetical protein